MQGRATVGGHPIHPALVTFPVGCFVAAAISDIISIWSDPSFWARMSTWLIAFGLAGSAVAAFFGLIDYMSAPMSVKAKGIAGWHMTLNFALFVVFGTAFVLRLQNDRSVAGYVLTGGGIVILAISGYLGGALAHRYLVGASEEEVGEQREPADQPSEI